MGDLDLVYFRLTSGWLYLRWFKFKLLTLYSIFGNIFILVIPLWFQKLHFLFYTSLSSLSSLTASGCKQNNLVNVSEMWKLYCYLTIEPKKMRWMFILSKVSQWALSLQVFRQVRDWSCAVISSVTESKRARDLENRRAVYQAWWEALRATGNFPCCLSPFQSCITVCLDCSSSITHSPLCCAKWGDLYWPVCFVCLYVLSISG